MATNVGYPALPSAQGQFGQAIIPTSQIELTISAQNLLNLDITSRSDPYCLVMTKDSWQNKFFEIGRTETIKDNLSPEWTKKFIINYNFEMVQRIRFEIWDKDPGSSDEFLGYHETTLAEIVSYTSRRYIRPLTEMSKRPHPGEIVVVAEELSTCKQIVQFQFGAEGLPHFFCGLSSPDAFLVISRTNEDGSYSVVYRTKQSRPSTKPVWESTILSVRTICNGDYDRAIKIECFDARASGDHHLIGSVFTSLLELTKQDRQTKFAFQKSSSSPSKKRGHLIVKQMVVSEEYSFIDYIKSGTQMHFAVAIDFTASNGAPHDPRSLHFMNKTVGFEQNPNPYQMALRAVGEIIQPYDSSGMYPAFGFGAKVPPNGEVSHQFPLNNNPSHPYCANIDEILTHYKQCLSSVTLYGPTNFSPVIQNTAQIASRLQDGKHYFTLLIITDGAISDMHHTKNAIIDASDLPLSIIIVGVGNADFGAMDELDSDDTRLAVDGRSAKRDIVQFVPLNKFLSGGGVPTLWSHADLAKEVLAEIPDQMVGYMKSKGLKPSLVTGQ